jgi:hypothetical protein
MELVSRHSYGRSDRIASFVGSPSGIGAAGVHAIASWQDSARYALVASYMRRALSSVMLLVFTDRSPR